MKKAITIVLTGCVAVQLAACASTDSAGASRKAAAPAPRAVNMGDAKTLTDVPYGYQLVLQKGEEFYCKRTVMTGSRTNSKDTCLTKAQMLAQVNGTQDYLKRTQETTNGADSRGDPGGRYNSAVTQ